MTKRLLAAAALAASLLVVVLVVLAGRKRSSAGDGQIDQAPPAVIDPLGVHFQHTRVGKGLGRR